MNCFTFKRLLGLMKVKVDGKNTLPCISCYCSYSASPLMVIDSYSPLLSQTIVRAGSSRTSVDNLQRETANFLP